MISLDLSFTVLLIAVSLLNNWAESLYLSGL